MIKIYEQNGLPFYDAAWIRDRQYIQSVIADIMTGSLKGVNKAWQVEQIEAPSLIPAEFVSQEYTEQDIYVTQDYALRPETTAASYLYAKYLLDHQETQPPLCIWQASKSFRRENDQVSANVRLKEFYQQEFQCIYTHDTKKDYHELVSDIARQLSHVLGTETRVVDSDRLPNYSLRTLDIEAKTPHKWLEICSISKRTDVPFEWKGRELLNTEFAFGLDRCVYVKNLPKTEVKLVSADDLRYSFSGSARFSVQENPS